MVLFNDGFALQAHCLSEMVPKYNCAVPGTLCESYHTSFILTMDLLRARPV